MRKVKVEVIKKYTDTELGKELHPPATIEVSEERAKALAEGNVGKIIGYVEVQDLTPPLKTEEGLKASDVKNGEIVTPFLPEEKAEEKEIPSVDDQLVPDEEMEAAKKESEATPEEKVKQEQPPAPHQEEKKKEEKQPTQESEKKTEKSENVEEKTEEEKDVKTKRGYRNATKFPDKNKKIVLKT